MRGLRRHIRPIYGDSRQIDTSTNTTRKKIMATVDTTQMKDALLASVAEIDEQIDAHEGTQTSGVRAFKNSLVNEHGAKFENSATGMAAKFAELSDAELIAAVVVVSKALAAFDERIKNYVDTNLPKPDPDAEKLSDAQVAELYDLRKKYTDQYKNLVTFAEGVGEDTSSWVAPARRNRSKGKRGQQVLSTYVYSVFNADGEEIELSEDDGINEIAKANGYANGRALRAVFKDQATWTNEEGEEVVGIDTSNPPHSFRLVMGNGNEVVAEKPEID